MSAGARLSIERLLRCWEADDALVPVVIDCSNAEEEVVLGDSLDGGARHVADLDGVRPGRSGRVPIDDLVAREIGLRVRLPFELRIDREGRGFDLHPGRSWGPARECGESGPVDLRHVGDVVIVEELRQVAELDAVFDPYVLVLVPKVLVRLREPVRRVAIVEERNVVAGP